jgi:hemerythrin-like domain-containing protein
MLRDPSLIPLSRDHHHALALCLRTRRALDANRGATSLPENARLIVEKFDSEIRGHFKVEEQVLFPVFSTFAELAGLVDELLAEHRLLVQLVERLRTSSERAVLVEFAGTLERHIRKEERELFESAQRLLSREQLDCLGDSGLSAPSGARGHQAAGNPESLP